MAIDLSFGGSAFPRAFEVRQKLYQAGLDGASTRYRRLDRYDAFYKCLEYVHLEHDWSGYPADVVESISPDVILPTGFVNQAEGLKVHQKRPTAPQRLTPLVVDRFTDLLFGEDRTPRVQVEDDPIADDFLQAVFKQSFFWREMTQARSYGGSMGSSLVTVGLKKDRRKGRGRFVFKAHNPKTISDYVWDDPDSRTLAGVLIQYLFFREVEVVDQKTGRPTGKVQQMPFLYRRIIDEEMDVHFHPAPVEGTNLPELVVDEYQTHRHGLGIFPGVWIQNIPCSDDFDGIPDCEGAYQLFEAIDRQVSQQNRALLVNQDPTLILGRDPKLEKMNVPIRKGSENALNVGIGGSASYLEMSGSAQSASSAFVKDLKQSALDKCQVILADPATMSGAAQSALAIKLLFQPMLKKAARLREQYGEGIETITAIVLELARLWAKPAQYTGNVVPLFDVPPRIVEKDPDPLNPDIQPAREFVERSPGFGSLVSLKWGEFFPPTPGDIQMLVSTTAAAVMANLIDIETGIQLVARAFGIEDVEGLKRRVLEQMKNQPVQNYGDEFGVEESPLEEGEGDTGEGSPDEALAVKIGVGGTQALVSIVQQVHAHEIPVSSALEMILELFGLPKETAIAIIGQVNEEPPAPEGDRVEGPRGGM
jgi:hypothetical protein